MSTSQANQSEVIPKVIKEEYSQKPIVIVTGSSGNIGSALLDELKEDYLAVGFDRDEKADFKFEITSVVSIQKALSQVQKKYGSNIAAVVHLAAYFDFTGEDSPLYEEVNVKGTKNLLDALQDYKVEHFIYASTMLVHRPGNPGDLITEDTPIEPRWAYPKSKANAEKSIQDNHGNIPYTLLRLGGLYDDTSAVPTLAHQIARIYEYDPKSKLYAGDSQAGQAFIHREDLIKLFKLTVEKRKYLNEENVFLAGEPGVMSYEELQHSLGKLIHGENDWKTISLPEPIAKIGAWIEEKSEPLIPDDFDEGEKPFIKPFMIDFASDHYELDIRRVKQKLDWEPKHRIQTELAGMIENLKSDPAEWYKRNQIKAPAWVRSADKSHKNPEQVRKNYEDHYVQQHRDNIWAPFINIGLGFWLISSPISLGYQSVAMTYSDIISGFMIFVFAALSLSANKMMQLSRWVLGVIGLWLLSAPLIFWAPTAAAYLNDTIIGALVLSFAMLVRPFPRLMSPTAAEVGPSIPPGWTFSPSDWFQRLPIIALAFVGFIISRYLTAYQLGHIDGVWDPYFAGSLADPKNGTEEIITSSLSKAWPVPDAGIGALTYLLEILTGIIGSRQRWRTMPWLVLLFGFMIVPLGAISITFIIIQPIVLGTWCTLCLIAAAAMLIQIPYSFDEIVATIEFLGRRAKAGQPWLLILFTGDTDEPSKADKKPDETIDNFIQSPTAIIKQTILGGVSLPWHLLLSALVGVWLMFTRLTIGASGNMANSDHLIGALVLTITITATAEVIRPIRFLNIFLGMALLIIPFVLTASIASIISSLLSGSILIVCSIPRGKLQNTYGKWDKHIV